MLSPVTRSNSAPCGTHPLSEWGDGLSVQSIVSCRDACRCPQAITSGLSKPQRFGTIRQEWILYQAFARVPWKPFTFREPPAIRCWLGLVKPAMMGATKARSPHITMASRSALARHQVVSGAIRMD